MERDPKMGGMERIRQTCVRRYEGKQKRKLLGRSGIGGGVLRLQSRSSRG